MRFFFNMLGQGYHYLQHDRYLGHLVSNTLQLALYSTVIAAVLGFPLACVIGLGRARVSRSALVVANAGLGLPPVAIGVFGFLLLPSMPAALGGNWTSTMRGIVLGQTLLSLPVIIALGAISIRRLPPGLVEQALAFGATGWRLGAFVLREAKIGAITAVIVAAGAAMGEVGAVTLIGGTSSAGNPTTTLAAQIINDANGFPGMAGATGHLMVLLAFMLALGVLFSLVQFWGSRSLTAARHRRPATTLEEAPA
jgi:tungstate transport system permease protein